jgi:hypothetical protein
LHGRGRSRRILGSSRGSRLRGSAQKRPRSSSHPTYCSDSPSTCVCGSSGESPGTAAVLITTTREGRATVVQSLWSKLDGIDVGNEIELAATTRTFQTYENFIVRVARNDQADAGAPAFIARQTLAVFTGDSMIPCNTRGSRSLPLSKAAAISALRSADPQASENYLASLDKGWTTTARQKDPNCGGMRAARPLRPRAQWRRATIGATTRRGVGDASPRRSSPPDVRPSAGPAARSHEASQECSHPVEITPERSRQPVSVRGLGGRCGI